MKKRKSTIHDIAKALNITASTVSRALNDNPRISEETKKSVHKIARKLNYQPNNIAAALRNGKSKILGVIVPRIDRSFFSSAVRGIEEIANTAGYNVMICQTHENYQKEVATVEALLNARVEGVIASYSKDTVKFDHFLKVKEKGIPLVLFDRTNDELNVSQVAIDDFLGAYYATTHLIEQGYSRIAHFTNIRKISIFKERLRGYQKALADRGIPFDEALVQESNLQFEDGRRCMQKLLELPNPADAVFSASALSAMGAVHVLKENGKKIPEEVGVVGFSDESFASLTDPQLTTVDQHSIHLGNKAAEIFLEELSGGVKKFIPQKVVLKPDLIIRKSSLRKPVGE
jgi:LacI family transcriptional regulator